MSYNLQYKIEFTNKNAIAHEILIERKDYSGAVIELSGGSENPQLVKDVNASFMGTSLSFSIESLNNAGFINLFTEDPRLFRVIAKRAGVIIFQGFLVPEQYSDAYVSAPFDVSITAVDGLGLLKNEDFDFFGNYTELQVVQHILAKTGHSLNLKVGLKVRYEGQANAARPALEYVIINTFQFRDDKGELMNCYDVLNKIMSSYGLNVYLTQDAGEWSLFRLIDFADSFVRYSTNGAFINNVTKSPLQFGSGKQIYPNGYLNRDVNKRFHRIEIRNDLGRTNTIFPETIFEKELCPGTSRVKYRVKNWIAEGVNTNRCDYLRRFSNFPLAVRFDPAPPGQVNRIKYLLSGLQAASGSWIISVSLDLATNYFKSREIIFPFVLMHTAYGGIIKYLSPTGWVSAYSELNLVTGIDSGFVGYGSDASIRQTDFRVLVPGIPADGSLTFMFCRPKQDYDYYYDLALREFSFAPDVGTNPVPAFVNYRLNTADAVINPVELESYGSSPDYPNRELLFRNVKRGPTVNDVPLNWYHRSDTEAWPLAVINMRVAASDNRKPRQLLNGALMGSALLNLHTLFIDKTTPEESVFWVKTGAWDLWEDEVLGSFEEFFPFIEQTSIIEQMVAYENFSSQNDNPYGPVTGSSSGGQFVTLSWQSITGRPSTFPPSSHTHAVADIPDLAEMFELVKPNPANSDTWYIRARRNLAGDGEIMAFADNGQMPLSLWDSLPVATALKLGGIKAHTTFQSGIRINANGFLEIDPTYAEGVESWNDLQDKPTWLNYGTLSAFEGGHGHSWAQITGKPSTFAPSAHSHAIADVTGLQTALNGKENSITAGTTAQYWRGDKSWQTLNTTAVAEGTNQYFTNARAQAAITGGASTITMSNLTASRALVSNASGKVAVSSVTSAELGYMSGVTSAIQTQLNSKLAASIFNDLFEVVGSGASAYIRAKMSLASVGELMAYEVGGAIPSMWDSMPFATATTVGGVRVLQSTSAYESGIRINATTKKLEIDPSYASGAAWGQITGTLSNQIDLQNALNAKENAFSKNTAFNKNFGTASGTVAEGNHLHTGVYEPAFAKNTAFNRNFAGTGSAITVARSDHNHSTLYHPLGGGSNNDFTVKDLIIHGTVNHWLGDTITVDDANLQLNRRQGGATVSSGMIIYNKDTQTEVSKLEYDTAGVWRAGGQRLYTDAYRPYSDNSGQLGGFNAADYVRRGVNETISGLWNFTLRPRITSAAPGIEFFQTDSENAARWVLDGANLQMQVLDYTTAAFVRSPIIFNVGAPSSSLTVSSDGNIGFGGNIAVSGTASITGNTTFGGNLTFSSGTKTIQLPTTRIRDNNGKILVLSAEGAGVFLFRPGGNAVSTNQTTINTDGVSTGNILATGNITAQGEVTGFSTSDKRLKQHITPMADALSIIDKLNPVTFRWNNTARKLNNNKDERLNYGLIAQELEDVCPELIHAVHGKYKGVDYTQLISVLIAAVKELKREVNELKH